MWASLAIVLPVFGLIGLGYAARRLGLVSDATGEGLSDFVFTLSVPCLIFRTLARAELRIFLEEWLKIIPDFRLDPDHSVHTRMGNVNGVKALHLLWDA